MNADVIRIPTGKTEGVSRPDAMGGRDRKFNAGSGGEGAGAGVWRASGTGTVTGSTHDR